MTYTEIKVRNDKKYYYRVLSVRTGKKVSKKREYLGRDLSDEELAEKEKIADKKLGVDKKDLSALNKLKPKIIEILKKNNVKKAGVFGSYAEGKQRKNSDVDILVEPPKGIGLFGFTGLEMDLSEKLNKKVDLVTYNGLSPFLKERILKQEVRII